MERHESKLKAPAEIYRVYGSHQEWCGVWVQVIRVKDNTKTELTVSAVMLLKLG